MDQSKLNSLKTSMDFWNNKIETAEKLNEIK